MQQAESLVLETPDARRWANLFGASQDLAVAASALERLLSLPEDAGLNERLPLLDCALIRYRRCFGSGIRKAISRDDVLRVAKNHIKIHDHFYVLADKNVAHSVSWAEVCHTQINISVTNGNKVVQNVSVFHCYVIAKKSDILSLYDLIAILLNNIRDQYQIIGDRVEDRVMKMTQSDLNSLKPAVIPVNQKGDDLKKRRHF